MAATQAQRATLYTTLTDTIGEDAADTLMTELPPGGWDRMATKDDLAGAEARLAEALAVGLAQLSVTLTEGLTGLDTKITEGLTGLDTKITEGLTGLDTKITEGLAEAATERAKIVKSQARHLYVIVTTTVATIMAATISIWLALFAIAID